MADEQKPVSGNADAGSDDPKNGSDGPKTTEAGAAGTKEETNLDSKIQSLIDAKVSEIEKKYETKIKKLNAESKERREFAEEVSKEKVKTQQQLDEEKAAKENLAKEKDEILNRLEALEKEKADKEAAEKAKAEEDKKKYEDERKPLLDTAEKLAKKDASVLSIAKNLPNAELKTYLNQLTSNNRIDIHGKINTSGIPGIEDNIPIDKIPQNIESLATVLTEDPEKYKEIVEKLPYRPG